MGEVIYRNPKSDRFDRDIERQVRDTLDQLGDGESAPWVVSTIESLVEMPELRFGFKIEMPDGISAEAAQSINDQCS